MMMMESSPLVPLRPTGNRLPIYCVHSGTGTAFAYLPLAGQLGEDQPVYGLEAPGYDDDEETVNQVAELSQRYLQAITQERPGEPICLLGWSMGGTVAFDMAQRHVAAGGTVPLLVVVDASVFDPPHPVPPPHHIVRQFVFDLSQGDHNSVGYVDAVLAELPTVPEGAWPDLERALGGLTEAGVIPAELDIDTLLQRFAVFRANVEAYSEYRYTAGYHQPVVSIRASSSPPEWEAWHKFVDDVQEYVVPGDHYSIWRGDALEELAGIVARHMNQLPDHPSGGTA
jgi:thioesterase domain-containing protein